MEKIFTLSTLINLTLEHKNKKSIDDTIKEFVKHNPKLLVIDIIPQKIYNTKGELIKETYLYIIFIQEKDSIYPIFMQFDKSNTINLFSSPIKIRVGGIVGEKDPLYNEYFRKNYECLYNMHNILYGECLDFTPPKLKIPILPKQIRWLVKEYFNIFENKFVYERVKK